MPWARSPPTGRASGATRRRCCICASATGRKRRSGSTIRASGSSPAMRRPSYWGGCGTLPRVHQYRDLAVLDFALQPEQVDFTHAWLPEAEMDEVRHDGRPRRSCAPARALALLIGSAPFERVADGPDGRLRDPACRACARAGSCACPMSAARASLDAFARALRRTCRARTAGDGEIWLDDPDYGRVVCRPDGRSCGGGPASRSGGMDACRASVALLPGGSAVALPSHARSGSEVAEARTNHDGRMLMTRMKTLADRARGLGRRSRPSPQAADRAPDDVVLRRQRRRGDAGPAHALRGRRTPTSRSSSTTSPTT